MVCSGATLRPTGVVTWLRLAQAAAAEEEVGLVLDTRQADVVLHLEAVHPGGPVPAERLSGFEDGEARQPHAACGGAIAPHVCLAFQELGQGVDG